MSFWHELRPVLALFLAGRRRALLAGAALAAATVLAGMALLGLSGWFISATALAGLSSATALVFDVFMPSAGIRLLALGRTAARYAERLVTHDATLAVLADLRVRLFRGWARPEAARQLLLRPARLLFRLTADIDALDSLYLRLMVPVASALVAALAAGVALGLANAWLGLAMALWLIAACVAMLGWVARRSRGAARRRAYGIEALRARSVDLVAGQTDLAMAGRLEAQCAALAAADRYVARADDALNRLEAQAGAAQGVISALTLCGALLAAGLLVGHGTIGVPGAALILLIALTAAEPLAGLRRGALELGRTLLAARRLLPNMVEAAPAPDAAAAAGGGLAAGCAVQARGLGVAHAGAGVAALQDISLTLQAGEHVALVGPSGAGKSTLLAAIAGELAPQAGQVRALPHTLLTQRTELFQDSLRDNLRLACPGAADAQLWAALQAAGLEETAQALPQGLDTRLGEGGLGLSGGQARRLALARLLLRQVPLWLLDEPTEGLDAATARDVLGRLHGLSQERAILVATHVRREAALADRLLTMHGGRIVSEARRGEAGFEAALQALRPD
ncbi:thiol reductant ABC exporter subunit CydC [Variovorax terrae]|uniref:Thiol reductant ABC exporter subunit CydC n=1 Tax=Variovorax terrae TaxID=2923278 RepID=A0A9X1VRX5_9BURK|nr:thiol reductant ABC exporter subunit CydC [Variovorax terrae]MCJ0762721.1 thiol reductant ABC exporter subunit CydC [Variovorax terrae]